MRAPKGSVYRENTVLDDTGTRFIASVVDGNFNWGEPGVRGGVEYGQRLDISTEPPAWLAWL